MQSYLNNHRIAIKVFFLIPKELQEKLIHLIDSPENIIETLLINKRFDIIENIFYYFPQLKQDKLITYYAEKAMSFLKINRVCESEFKENDFVIINEEIREKYNFSTAPDFKLFTKFMNLCEDIQVVAKICFDVSNNCSKHLLEKNPTQPKIIFINFISKVLEYIDERLKKCENEDISEIIDKLNFYEKLIELFKMFIYVNVINSARYR
jgi:hypothetical protein